MSEEADPDETRPLSISRKTLVLETVRISAAVGIGGAVTTILALGVSLVGPERLGPAAPAADLIFLLALFLPVVLYAYDRHHERDLVIADFGLLAVRPVAVLYRLLRVGGP